MRNLVNKLLIFGAGGHASKVLCAAIENNIDVEGYISTESAGTVINDKKVLGDIKYFLKTNELHSYKINIAIGENAVRYVVCNELKNYSENQFTVISPKAHLGRNVKLAAGSSVMPFVIINDHAEIGECCIIDSGAIVEHHVKIGNFVNVSPGAVVCGGALIENGAVIGASATVIEKIKIGKNSLIGAGSVVLSDVPENSVAVGNPAKVIKSRNFNEKYLR